MSGVADKERKDKQRDPGTDKSRNRDSEIAK
jgi:hypothetical protein